MAMDIDHAEGNLLLQGLPLEPVQEVEAGVRHLEVQLVDGKFVEVREDVAVVPVAGVEDRVRLEALRHDADRLHEERELIEPRGQSGLIDLDDLRAGGLEGPGLLMEEFREGEAG